VGLTGNLAALRALRRSLLDLAKPDGRTVKDVGKNVAGEIDEVLREQFATGVGPDGEWDRTRRGRPALVSSKLAAAFRSRLDRGVLRYVARTPRNWLAAQHEGHVFPARKVAALSHYMNFNSKGKLVAARRVVRKDGTPKRGSYQRFAAGHTVRERVLPARLLYPTGALPAKWSNAISRGVGAVITRWYERSTR
jgi:hypothetical protein